MQISGSWRILFAIVSAAKLDIQACGGKSASQRCSHQHQHFHETGNGHDKWQLSDCRLDMLPPSPVPFFPCKVGGNLIFSLHIFLDRELFTYMFLELETLTGA